MTGVLLNLAELAALADVPVDRLREYAEVGLLPPARREGDRLGYPASEADTMRLLGKVQALGIAADDLPALTRGWRDRDCGAAQQQLVDAVTARLDMVQLRLGEQQQLATRHGPGTPKWVEATQATVSLSQDAARLQAVTAALRANPHAGACGEDCGCITALDASGDVYHFPTTATDEPGLACDLAADAGDASNRIGAWQQVFTRVQRRDPLDDTQTGLALRFPLDGDLAATLARLAAAEYRCCSFGSYTIVIDHTGLRLEIRMPDGATDMLAAVVGVPDSPGTPDGDPA
ncbi:MerR family transcriptional regulator [Actinoplanes sp. NPDC051633]|uniref:MerR family transcriptional regulator n=1 Tax=Actinoplanes sp. NPDC051633 TaxID=3155670 RepID=UPI00342889CA